MATDERVALLDTSVVVRYLTADPPDGAAAAAAIIDTDRPLALSGVALAELWYVLRDHYQVPRSALVDALQGLVGRANISVLGIAKPRVLTALEMCRPSGRVSIADALMWAEARQAGLEIVFSFDRRFPSDEVELREA